MSEIERALDQISQIHDHLARTEVGPGVRALPVALSGLIGILGAALQPQIVEPWSPRGFVFYWAAVCLLTVVVGGLGIARTYLREPSRVARRQTRLIVGQFLPCLAAGALLGHLVVAHGAFDVSLLPGLWAILFSLGVFAARPYLPRVTGWVALAYLGAGGVLLALAPAGLSLSPWAMGLTFGLGQVAGGAVLYRDIERSPA